MHAQNRCENLRTAVKNKTGFSRLFPAWLLLFTLGHFSHHLLTALPVPLMPFIRDNFSLDYARSGLLLSVFSITYGLSQLPSGWLSDRLGTRILMAIGICGVGLAGVLIGFTSGYVMLLVLLGLMGILGGGYHPSAPPIVSTTLPAANRGRAIGVHAIGGSAAYFIAPLIASTTAATWGWRSSFLVLAAPTLAFGLLLYFLMAGRKPKQEVASDSTECKVIPRKAGNRHDLLAFMALSSVTTIVTMSVMSFIPLFLVDHFGMSQASAALVIAIVYFTGIFANPVSGFLSDRVGRIPLLVSANLGLLPVLFFMNSVPQGWGVNLVLVSIGIIIAMTQTSSESHIVGNVAEKNCSSVLGVYYFTNMAGAGVLTPMLGALIDARGPRFSLTILTLVLGAAVLAYCLRLLSQRHFKPQTEI
ncbi:MAG: MFS transporter [Dehalococcoidia bacterium]|nr:MAG: MFS transporter [Dehalococcoidia bacterium]